jgi:hypothetical protein
MTRPSSSPSLPAPFRVVRHSSPSSPFWLKDAQRRNFKVFKPLEGVVLGDPPPAWLKDVLYAEQEVGFSCC